MIDADRLRDRLQFEIGGRWQMVPGRRESWRQWFFDPFFGLTRIGQRIYHPLRGALPEGPEMRFLFDILDDGIDDATKLKKSIYISRVFWLRGGCRFLGLDIGFGIYFRRPIHITPAPVSPTAAAPPAAETNSEASGSASGKDF
jgi:hypothetical protein